MEEQNTKRLVGRIDRVFRNAINGAWGYLFTEDLKEYIWHSNQVRGPVMPTLRNIVTFEAADPFPGTKRPRAINIDIVTDREIGAEGFATFARGRNRGEEEVA